MDNATLHDLMQYGGFIALLLALWWRYTQAKNIHFEEAKRQQNVEDRLAHLEKKVVEDKTGIHARLDSHVEEDKLLAAKMDEVIKAVRDLRQELGERVTRLEVAIEKQCNGR